MQRLAMQPACHIILPGHGCRPKAPRKKKAPRVRQDPSRHSSRLRGEGAQTDDVSDLALFIINEACPRCGKVCGTCPAGAPGMPCGAQT